MTPVALPGEGESRLNDFIEWAYLSGVEENRLRDFRRVATDLLTLADGGRVNESHILKLIDAHSEGPAGKAAVSLIEDVGEQILRYQVARKSSGVSSTPAPQPMAPMPNAPSRPHRGSTSQPFVPRPEERVAGELRPPVAISTASETPVPAVVSFATGSAPPQPPGSSSQSTQPASQPASQSVPPVAKNPSGPLLVASPQPDRSTRRSATLFRCFRCKVMVESDPSGACPRCGTPAPKMQSSTATPVVGAPSQRWLVASGAIVALAVVAAVIAPRLLERLHHPSEPVGGEFRSQHLGVRMLFPDDWRHLREGDRAPAANLDALADVFADPLSVRSSRFFRGSPGSPDAELYLVVGARAPALSDAALATWAKGAIDRPEKLADPVRELTGVADLRVFQCVFAGAVPHGGLRCTAASAHTAAVVYVWARGNVNLALFLSEAGPEDALAESGELVGGVDTGT